MEFFSALIIPVIVLSAGLIMLIGGSRFFDSFITGAKTGLNTAVNLLPALAALVTAVSMLNASGALDFISSLIAPFAAALGIPDGLLPLLITRPVSGSAATAVYSSLLETYGPDSFEALCASVIMGSSDTLIYVITVYFSAAGVKKTRYAFLAALAVMLFCIFLSCFVCRLFF
jgi:spore maturation protein B